MTKPERTSNNYRVYQQAHLQRLCFIRNCRSLDMTHREIKGLIELLDNPLNDCSAVNRVVEQHIHHVRQRIVELSQLEVQLTELGRQCQQTQTIEECGIVKGLASMELENRTD